MNIRYVLSEVLLINRSPRLEDLTRETLESFYRERATKRYHHGIRLLSRVLASRGIIDRPLNLIAEKREQFPLPATLADVPPEWIHWCQRWHETSTLALKSRKSSFRILIKAGRWLAREHPGVVTPEAWTREIAADYVASIDRMTVGQWSQSSKTFRGKGALRVGVPITARTKARELYTLRRFFLDCMEWGWIKCRFDPQRIFATPRSVCALIGPKPRIIADDVWAKLLWAGLNLTTDDLPQSVCNFGPSRSRSNIYL